MPDDFFCVLTKGKTNMASNIEKRMKLLWKLEIKFITTMNPARPEIRSYHLFTGQF